MRITLVRHKGAFIVEYMSGGIGEMRVFLTLYNALKFIELRKVGLV